MALPLITHARGSKALVLALPHKSDDEVDKLKRDALAGLNRPGFGGGSNS